VRVGASARPSARISERLPRGRWDTRSGTIDLKLPKLREGNYFPDWLLDRRRRAEKRACSTTRNQLRLYQDASALRSLFGLPMRALEDGSAIGSRPLLEHLEVLGDARLHRADVPEPLELSRELSAFRRSS
jgi:hypothetical protein